VDAAGVVATDVAGADTEADLPDEPVEYKSFLCAKVVTDAASRTIIKTDFFITVFFKKLDISFLRLFPMQK
jgi:hypothetical protein